MLFEKKETDEEISKRLFELTDKQDYGLFPPPMEAQVALDELCNFFLGKDWYVSVPMGKNQINHKIVYEIERKFIKYKKN